MKQPLVWILSMFWLSAAAKECQECQGEAHETKAGVAMLVKAYHAQSVSEMESTDDTEGGTEGIKREAALVRELLKNPTAEFTQSTVQKLASMRITPSLQAFIDETLTSLDSVFDDLKNASVSDTELRDKMLGLFDDAAVHVRRTNETLEAQGKVADAIRTRHDNCRTNESNLFEEKKVCQSEESVLLAEKYAAEKDLRARHNALKSLLCSNYTVVGVLQDKVRKADAYVIAGRKYIEAERNHTIKETECDARSRNHSLSRQTCNGVQQELEANLCYQATVAFDGCKAYNSAYNVQKTNYETVQNDIAVRGAKRIFEWLHLKRTQCTLRALSGHTVAKHGELTSVISKCNKANYSNPRLVIAQVPAPATKTCAEAPPQPCTEAFVAKEYAHQPKGAPAVCLRNCVEVVLTTMSSFEQGTYRIVHSGVYKLAEDIAFDPNPRFPDKFSQMHPQLGGYYLGFFAAVTIEADDVVFDCQGHTIGMSPRFHKFQRFFSIFELGSKPFISRAGPPQFKNALLSVGEVKSANRITIQNCTIGLSAHHSIHGNENNFVTLRNLKMVDFEVGGVHLNGASQVLIEDCKIGPSLAQTWGAMLSHVAFLDHMMNTLVPAVPEIDVHRDQVKVNLRGEEKIVGTIFDELHGHYEEFLENTTGPLLPLVGNGTSLPDGSAVYGIVVSRRGPAIMDFGSCPFAKALAEGKMEDNITIRRVVIKDLHLRAEQWTRLVIDGKQVMGPGGDVFRYMKARDRANKYVGSTIADAQIAVGEFKRQCIKDGRAEHELAWYFGGVHIPDVILDWAKGPDPFTATAKYQCFGDAMSHVNKGVVGLRLEYVTGLTVEDVTISNLSNEGTNDADSNLCSQATATLGRKYIGKDVSGAAIVNCQNVKTARLTLEKETFLSPYGGTIYPIRNFRTCEDLAGVGVTTCD